MAAGATVPKTKEEIDAEVVRKRAKHDERMKTMAGTMRHQAQCFLIKGDALFNPDCAIQLLEVAKDLDNESLAMLNDAKDMKAGKREGYEHKDLKPLPPPLPLDAVEEDVESDSKDQSADEVALDPFLITTEEQNVEQFKKLDFFEQFDAAVNNASRPDMKTLPGFVIGLVFWCLHAAACTGLTYYLTGAELWSTPFHEALLKNVIAWDAIANHHGFHTFYRALLGGGEYAIKYELGSVKEPLFPAVMGRRRTVLDVLIHLAFDASRIWLIVSNEPSPMCAWIVFGSTAAMYVFDFGEYVGLYGMYHGPWSVFLLAKYYSEAQGAAGSVLQFELQLLYIGCGLGKMGPWFAAVFNQEWTLPPWATVIDLRSLLYKGDFPKDNTPSALGTALAYLAATAEWVAPLLLLCTPDVLGAAPGTMTICVFLGLFVLISMHLYINLHMPAFDVWMLNFTPAYLVYNIYYKNPALTSPGFDYAGFRELHPAFQAFCCGLGLYCIYGQLLPEHLTYMHCYRFWAGNWPQSWVFVSKSGMQKLKAAFSKSATRRGEPGGLFAGLQGPLWVYNFLGIFQTAQLPHRILPMVLHKALLYAAKARGEKPCRTLTDFEASGGHISFGSLFFGWASGFHVNDALRGRYLIKEFQSECGFEPGECVLIEGGSFPLFAGLSGASSRWAITDANEKVGIVEEGQVTVTEAMAITKPSLLRNYDGKKSI